MTSPFEGSLIRLRAREPEDAPLLYQWFNDPEVTEHLAMRYPLSMKSEREFIERVSSPGYAQAGFAIETIADRRLIGGVDLQHASPERRCASLGIAVGDGQNIAMGMDSALGFPGAAGSIRQQGEVFSFRIPHGALLRPLHQFIPTDGSAP